MVTHRGLVPSEAQGKRSATERYVISYSTIRKDKAARHLEKTKNVAFALRVLFSTTAVAAENGDS